MLTETSSLSRVERRRACTGGHLLLLALTAGLLAGSASEQCKAQVPLAYSMEGDLQGFVGNGNGITVSLDTFGATEGLNSMKVELLTGAFFAGPLTSIVAPQLGDPPGVEVIQFDLTINQAFPSEGFIDAGIVFFAATQPGPGQLFGQQIQFQADQVSLGDLPVGTHQIEIILSTAFHPVTFAQGTFNELFGVEGSGPDDLIPTGFEIYFNKSTNAPWTGYIDNIRIGMMPPVFDADFNDDTFVDSLDLGIWKDAFGQTALGDANGDSITDGNDFLIWQRQYSPPPAAAFAIPEPSTLGLFGFALLQIAGGSRLRARKAPRGRP